MRSGGGSAGWRRNIHASACFEVDGLVPRRKPSMSRLFAVSMLLVFALSDSAMAQNGGDLAAPARQFFTEDGRQLRSDAEISAYLASLEAETRRRLNSVCDDPRAGREHALIELCNWIGQHR